MTELPPGRKVLQVDFVDFVEPPGKATKVTKRKMIEFPPVGKVLLVEFQDVVKPPENNLTNTKQKHCFALSEMTRPGEMREAIE